MKIYQAMWKSSIHSKEIKYMKIYQFLWPQSICTSQILQTLDKLLLQVDCFPASFALRIYSLFCLAVFVFSSYISNLSSSLFDIC